MLSAQGIEIKVSDIAKKELSKIGFDPSMGARPLRRAIQKEIENMLSSEMLKGNVKKGDKISIDYSDKKFSIKK